jgi:hypothetical protein
LCTRAVTGSTSSVAAEARVRPVVRVHDPSVLVGELRRDDGRIFTWFVSRSPGPLAVEPETGGHTLVDEAGEPVGKVELGPYGVVVLERS